ncbi:hypothetical protein [Bacillus sp. OxB-1]|uniref:hypothetical protein n=1 Tax=Bacillus sp. (strain OxB-1) TaxID=98228 RepID=UPI000AB9366E|nr:hypothetical protein [Bacillus sp. OxB-1]
MVNMQPDNFGEEMWYPQLPEGYLRGSSVPGGDSYDDWYPGQAAEFYPGQSMSGYPSGGPFTAQRSPGLSPGHGGFPGFPPSGGGFPGQGMPGFPPSGGGFPGQGVPGFPPGTGFPPGAGFPGQGGPPGGGFPGQGGPPGGGLGQQAPTTAPPNYTPAYPETQLFAVDPGGIRRCLYRFTFVWLSRRQGFWFFPVFVGRNSVAGYRWRNRQRRWEYFGIDLNRIDAFTC